MTTNPPLQRANSDLSNSLHSSDSYRSAHSNESSPPINDHRSASSVNIQRAEPTKLERASAISSGLAVSMRSASRGFLSPVAFATQATLGTANFLLEGTTDIIFQVAKKGGLKEIGKGETHFSEIMQHNFHHDLAQLSVKPYAQHLFNDAKADFQQAKALFNRTHVPQFEVKQVGSDAISTLSPAIQTQFANKAVRLELGESQKASQHRALHFLKHASMGIFDLTKATLRAGLSLGIFGIQTGKAIGTFLIASTVDISFALLKKGGLKEFLQDQSHITSIITRNFDRNLQQIKDKPYAQILLRDALHDFYSFRTKMESSVAFDDTETGHDTQQPPSTRSVATPTNPANATHHNDMPIEIDIASDLSEQHADDIDDTNSQYSGFSEDDISATSTQKMSNAANKRQYSI